MPLLERASRWQKLTLLAFILGSSIYIGVCWHILDTVITPLRKEPEQTPADLGFTKVEPLLFRSTYDGISLKGWLVPSYGDRAVLLIHGIHSHAWDCQAPDLVRAYSDEGFHVLLFDLRGHGKSGGDHVGLGWLERGDVRAAVDLLLDRGFEPGKIGIHGTSYGAATTILAAAVIPEIGAVIADSSFANVLDVIGGEIQRETGLQEGFAKLLIPGIKILARWRYSLDLNEVSPEQAIAEIRPRPLLLIHGNKDQIISVKQARRLKVAAGSYAELWLLPDGHVAGVRWPPDCKRVSSTRGTYLNKTVRFFKQSF